jgi:hypothetical protein
LTRSHKYVTFVFVEYFQTYSGVGFDPFDPAPGSINLEDIARGCANECRFQRQCGRFYSSAEHQWHISYMVPKELALEAALHDASDAYLGDAARLVKRSKPFRGFWSAEIDLQKRIYHEFGIVPTQESKDIIHKADVTLMRNEAASLMGRPRTAGWESYDLDNISNLDSVTIYCWSPEASYLEYIRRLHHLIDIRNGSGASFAATA